MSENTEAVLRGEINVSLERYTPDGPTVITVTPDNEKWSLVVTLQPDMTEQDNDLLVVSCDRLNEIADQVVSKVEAEIAARS